MLTEPRKKRAPALFLLLAVYCTAVSAFQSPVKLQHVTRRTPARQRQQDLHRHPSKLSLFQKDDRSKEEIEEEVRLNILEDRRQQIRTTLKSAEGLRNFRINKGLIPELDEDGNPIKSDGKLAISLTAFVIAGGAIALRIGGRAALVSVVGLDFMTDNPELKNNLDMVLTTADAMGLPTKLALFTAAWTAVKCLLFDAGGVVLALASGILFGGVIQGAVVSAAAATVGSCVAFGLAKLDTPVRKKALEILDEYPSLRGIEKVVARDGLKAILTLRLAPVLPIPLGMYNYIYGVTNVALPDLVGGIFLGSLKPYLLDSYLGYFGKSLVDGTGGDTGLQDMILLAALGVSVLIGVFASQLAGETWDSVLQEVEAEKKEKEMNQDIDGEKDEDDGVTREFLGWKLPEWMLGFQFSLQDADERVRDLVAAEYEAKVWNFTKAEGGPPAKLNPATFPNSPEVREANQGLDVPASLCDGLVLSPILFEVFLKYADPLYKEDEDEDVDSSNERVKSRQVITDVKFVDVGGSDKDDKASQATLMFSQLGDMRAETEKRLALLDERLNKLSDKS